ncbi:hypothetical protein MLD38_019338 [Melastoma candidum]|uniref:Uncharacterized protein n=1 Tax=Melastoma candidum TaxID=119954 RepID=A0ACB9QWN8_9MYRT|nr:hypothetical protein MLD38_019338 [Melastoma candidum]
MNSYCPSQSHQLPRPVPAFSVAHLALQRASVNPTLPVLKQIHAHLIVSRASRSLSLFTKLLRLVAGTVTSSSSSSLTYALRIFRSLPQPDAFLLNTLITQFSKSVLPIFSLYFYQRMLLSNVHPSSYTFTSVIKACGNSSDSKVGRVVHGQVLTNGYGLDPYVQASLVSFYGKIGEVKFARKLFDGMPDKSVVAWNSMICGYEQNGRAKEAIDVFLMMREARDVNPDSTTFVGVLSACAELGALELGHWVHEYLEQNGFHMNVVLGTAMINMYARCGNVAKAREVFDDMDERNVIASTAMINAYGMNGYGKLGVEIFDQMLLSGQRPNSITFVAVLSACAHAGLVEVGRRVFASMKEEHVVEPGVEHLVCMVDMLGRAGLLDEAYEFIEEKLPSNPPVAVWSAMLGACKMHKNFHLGLKVADRLLKAEPDNPCHYVLLSNIYATAGRTDGVQMVRNKMIRKGLKKQVGHSTTEVDGRTYMFAMGDKSLPETKAIYRYLDELVLRCMEVGYVPVADALMHELEGEEREHALKFHSEKLAIAFAMLKTNDGSTIRIVKNLRMCEDCHAVIKFMSTVTKREIIVRDKLRFHHFKEGSCSCLDYW